MRTLGLIGGTSWVSTLDYYRIINQSVNEKLGGLNSAKLFNDRLSQKNIETIIPNDNDREFIHQSIYNELIKGKFTLSTINC